MSFPTWEANVFLLILYLSVPEKSGKCPVDYSKFYTAQVANTLQTIKSEGRYREFKSLLRTNGEFPRAINRNIRGEDMPITLWCSNDYLGKKYDLSK